MTKSSRAATNAASELSVDTSPSRTAVPGPSSKPTSTMREVVVAFDREGTIRIPNDLPDAGRLEHGYAAPATASKAQPTRSPATTRPTVIVRGGLRRPHPRPPKRPHLHRRRQPTRHQTTNSPTRRPNRSRSASATSPKLSAAPAQRAHGRRRVARSRRSRRNARRDSLAELANRRGNSTPRCEGRPPT